jgi:hypothetical protein
MTMVTVFLAMYPLHATMAGMLALLCQDALVKKKITVRSLFSLTTVVCFELAIFRLVSSMMDQ